MAAVVIAVTVALMSVQVPLQKAPIDPEPPGPSPLGYTKSLAIFIVPLAALLWWFARHPEYSFQRPAFSRTIALVVPLGFVLDILLAEKLFTFENREAVVGLMIPVLGGKAPIEEFVFYAAGFAVILLAYIWADEYWLAAYNIPDYEEKAREIPRLLQFHPWSAVLGVGLIPVAILIRPLTEAPEEGFPLYFSFLVVAGVVPAVGLFRTTRAFINWRAFAFTLFMILLVSIIWEVTLALPYRWWGYQEKWMMGLFIKAWFRLPLEAVFVWLAVTFTTVIVYEVLKIWKASGRGGRAAFLGR